MRRWLWSDTLNNVKYYDGNKLIVHAIISVVLVFWVCTVIDYLRIRLVEYPIFNRVDQLIKEKDSGRN